MLQPQVLHRDDPTKDPLTGNVKVTREDWLNAALRALVGNGVEHVKVLLLAERLGVSRSSFYWYFKNRQDILDALLDHWYETNTEALVAHAMMPAKTVTEACCNVFRGFVTSGTFDTALDFTIRDWARRSDEVRRRLDVSDARRLNALTAMFERFTMRRMMPWFEQGRFTTCTDINADLRANGSSHDLMPHYVHVFTGQMPGEEEIATFRAEVIPKIEGQNP